MKYTSQTGLLSSRTKTIKRYIPNRTADDLKVSVINAPTTIKPFTGIFNPYAKGCSILCNHPAVPEFKKMLQKARENLGDDSKATIHPSEVAEIKAKLEQFHLLQQCNHQPPDEDEDSRFFASDISEIVPEELFRRYTDTDSRPLTPTPTLASAHTRASATRRCVTPDAIVTSQIREKTLLVLDLRRAHSQETLSWCGGSQGVNETPLIRIMNVNLTPASSRHSIADKRLVSLPPPPSRSHNRLQIPKESYQEDKEHPSPKPEEHDDDDGEYVKRRGKKRKKRRASSSVSIFRSATDPETLVAGIAADSKNPSARASLTEQQLQPGVQLLANEEHRHFTPIASFLDYESLRELRRELTKELVDLEFDDRRKMILEEALKTVSTNHVDCEELQRLQKELILPDVDAEFRFSLPRKFTRASVRFELPMDSRTLDDMSPMQYLKDNVELTSARKLLYRFIFNQHRKRVEIIEEDAGVVIDEPRIIEGKDIISALGTLMGKALTKDQGDAFQILVGWESSRQYGFKMFGAICALCERLLASEFYPNLPNRKEDPCQAIENIDFESLERKIKGRCMDERLRKILIRLKIE